MRIDLFFSIYVSKCHCHSNFFSSFFFLLGSDFSYLSMKYDLPKSWSHVQLFANPCTIALQASQSMKFSSKNTGECSHSFLQDIFPTQESKLGLLHYRQTLYLLSHPFLPKPSSSLDFRVNVITALPRKKSGQHPGSMSPLYPSWCSGMFAVLCSLRSEIVPCISSTGTFQHSAWCATLGLWTDPLLNEYSGALVVSHRGQETGWCRDGCEPYLLQLWSSVVESGCQTDRVFWGLTDQTWQTQQVWQALWIQLKEPGV